MEFKVAASLLLLVASAVIVQTEAGDFDVRKYGAAPGADITQAFLSAWNEACKATSPSKVLVPAGTYNMGEVKLQGPCKAPIELQLDGTVKAPADPSKMKLDGWFTFSYIDNFTISGKGTFDGQGEKAWAANDCGKNANCKSLTMNLRFNYINNGLVQGVTSLDSKNFHVNVIGCKNFTFQNFKISAPGSSINTDGIHIGRSVGVNITDTTIGTGDDCISIGDGTQELRITRVTCGPGHGISVGSLGRYAKEQPVSGIFVTNCTISNTDNGVRIKSWPAKEAGSASDMHFEDIIMNNVSNPVLIDQEYCPWNQCTKEAPSKVKISNVSFKNIRGTSGTPLAVKLACSSGIPCEGVELADVDLSYAGAEAAKSECKNVKPTITGKLNPAGCK